MVVDLERNGKAVDAGGCLEVCMVSEVIRMVRENGMADKGKEAERILRFFFKSIRVGREAVKK